MIGKEGEGWRGAQTTLSYERGGNALSAATGRRLALDRLIRTCQCAGMLDDARVRNKLGRMLVDIDARGGFPYAVVGGEGQTAWGGVVRAEIVGE